MVQRRPSKPYLSRHYVKYPEITLLYCNSSTVEDHDIVVLALFRRETIQIVKYQIGFGFWESNKTFSNCPTTDSHVIFLLQFLAVYQRRMSPVGS